MSQEHTIDHAQVEETVRAHWGLAAAGLSDMIWGHAALRASDGDGIYIKSSGYAFEEIDASRVLKVGWGGELLAGEGNVHIEVPIHTQVMAVRPDVGCVVHCHAPAITAFASLDQPIRAISHEGVFFAGDGRLPRFGGTGDLIRTRELGDAVAETLGDADALLLPQHGCVVAGPDMPTAVVYATVLERACAVQLRAMAAGGPAIWSDDEEIAQKRHSAFQPFAKTFRYLADVGERMHRAQLPAD